VHTVSGSSWWSPHFATFTATHNPPHGNFDIKYNGKYEQYLFDAQLQDISIAEHAGRLATAPPRRFEGGREKKERVEQLGS
jgi:hypothetical protein